MTVNPYRIVFMGCASFSIPSLEAVLQDPDFIISGVYTLPDRPQGRGKQLGMNPVKAFATERRLPVFSPESFRKDPEAVIALQALSPDFLVVVAYGLILPQSVLDIPRIAPVNVHASLLPKYRGPSPVHYAIINGDVETGNTIMLMNARMDEGDMLAQERFPVQPGENLPQLYERMSKRGAALLGPTLKGYATGAIKAVPQDHSLATYTGKIDSALARLDWKKPAVELERLIRAVQPSPGAWFDLDGERVKVGSAAVGEGTGSEPGTIVSSDAKTGLSVACGGKSSLRLLSLQKPGKGMIPTEAFLRGLKGSLLGKNLA